MDKQEIQVVQESYAMVTYNQIYAGERIDEFYGALYYRTCPYCEAAVLKTIEEADLYVRHKYYEMFFANPFLYNSPPMPMPVENQYNIRVSNSFFSIGNETDVDTRTLMTNREIKTGIKYVIPTAAIDHGKIYWGIDGMNGYAIARDLNMLVQFLISQMFIYPHAVSCMSELDASIKARENYVNRFIGRYGIGEKMTLPNYWLGSGGYFIDEDYHVREERLQSSAIIAEFKRQGLL